MKIALGTDHAGFRAKETVKKFFRESGHEVVDFGTNSEADVDYPDFIRPAAQAVASGQCERGVIFGGSGNGEAMTANHVSGIRCAVCWDIRSAELARRHNDANVISIGARMVAPDAVVPIVQAWLNASFEGGRHLRRIQKIEER